MPGTRTNQYGNKSLQHAAPNLWNSLQSNILNAAKLDSFKNEKYINYEPRHL